jgi:cysteine-rich repeat protein
MCFRNVVFRAALGALALSLMVACNVFDETLIPDEGQSSDALGEDCLDTGIPSFGSLNEFRDIDTSVLQNDRYELSCVGQSALGNDGFFSVDMTAGKKWHFHVKVTPGTSADPTVYVLDSGCQDSVCQRGWGLNECVAGQDEHFSFFPPRDGKYLVGVDTITAGGEPMQVLAVQPDCGNGVKEHSETCDDGNLVAGDGCDPSCRNEIPFLNSDVEVEPNDEPTANANVLQFEDGSVSIGGQVGGKCDFDSYAVSVPEGGSVMAALSGACSYNLRLQLMNPNGLTPLGTVDTVVGTCPMLTGTESFASGLSAGVYFLRLTTQVENEATPLDYRLDVQVVAP